MQVGGTLGGRTVLERWGHLCRTLMAGWVGTQFRRDHTSLPDHILATCFDPVEIGYVLPWSGILLNLEYSHVGTVLGPSAWHAPLSSSTVPAISQEIWTDLPCVEAEYKLKPTSAESLPCWCLGFLPFIPPLPRLTWYIRGFPSTLS